MEKNWTRNYVAQIYYLKGIIQFEKQNYREAIIEFEKVFKWNPVNVNAYMEILECCIKLNNWIKFEKTFKEAVNIALTPLELAIIYKKYAYFCTELKNYELAYNVLRYSMLICIREENQREI